ncbi:3-hydroxyacyl-CoA dehydrogenase NAD-binding domain-containing protein [Cyclobacterium salsum]|uniref:3-hydroxyacyl-CoA dehydrogenase NAD-binding domain-containing protein n=1 Tax=Cyclobacterium salsum TaxID=2666329 RepID=UPI001391992D|nr:3-hydroxyacyl-CoA dehydrogenase NAD-binding domain-containing protein [Cyclobacterium salsum]
MKYLNCKVAVVGEGKISPSVVCCLLQAGHQVKCFSPGNPTEEVDRLLEIAGLSPLGTYDWEENFDNPTSLKGFQIVVACTSEKTGEKENYLKKIDHAADQDALIDINSESIPLEHLQNQVQAPSRLLGVNRTYPTGPCPCGPFFPWTPCCRDFGIEGPAQCLVRHVRNL